MKGLIGMITLGMLAVGVMFLVIGYASPATPGIMPESNETQPTVPEVPTYPVYPDEPDVPTEPTEPVQPLPPDQPPPPNEEAPPSTPETPTWPTEPTATYSTKTFYSGTLNGGQSVTRTINYPIDHDHRIKVSVSDFLENSVIPPGGADYSPSKVKVYIDNVLVDTFTAPIPAMTYYQTSPIAEHGVKTVKVQVVTGTTGVCHSNVKIQCTNWPSGYDVLGAGVPDLSLFGLLLIAAAVILMVMFRK